MKYLISLALTLIFLTPAFSQINLGWKHSIGFAQGKYENSLNNDNNGNGIGAEVNIDVKAIPNLQVGASFTRTTFAKRFSTSEVTVVDTNGFLSLVTTINVFRFDDILNNYLGLVRYFVRNKDKSLRPFLQVQGGATNYKTVAFSDIAIDPVSSEFIERKGTTWLMSLSGGLNYRIVKRLSIQMNLGYSLSGFVNNKLPNNKFTDFFMSPNPPGQFENSRLNHIFLDLAVFYSF